MERTTVLEYEKYSNKENAMKVANNIITKKTTSKHIIIKLLKSKDQEKNWKAARGEKKTRYAQETMIRIRADLSSKIMGG